MGRPKTIEPASTRKSVTLPDTLWAELRDYRFNQRVVSDAETLRRIVRAGLDTEAARAAKGAK
jgi:hypothetical protein